MNAHTSIKTGVLVDRDWKVVEMAREDGPWSFNPTGPFARVARLFGAQIPLGLANEKLEALRRFSVRAWHWDLIRIKDMRALIDAGYSRTDVLQILARVASLRGFTPSVQEDYAKYASPSSVNELSNRRRSHGSIRCRCG